MNHSQEARNRLQLKPLPPSPPLQPQLAPFVLIDNYDSFTYNLYQMIQAQTSHPVVVYRNDAITFEALRALAPVGVILSPGPGHPAKPSDFGVCAEVLTRWLELSPELNVPVLGVCLGQQGMAAYFGGQVVQAPAIMHGKTSQVRVLKPSSPMLQGISNPFTAMRYHSLVAEESSLPACFEITAKDNDHDLIMAMEHKEWPLYGLQFHPESIGTPEGATLLLNFIMLCAARSIQHSQPINVAS
jgi:anthranilate synthase component II